MTYLTEEEVKKHLKKYNIPYEEGFIATKKEEAIKKATEYPLVLKIISPDITHKSDSNGVTVGIKNKEELGKEFDKLINEVKQKNPNATITGVLIQKMLIGQEIKTYKILAGARGKQPANIEAIADIITKVSKLMDENPEIQEIDFNPVIVNDKKATVVDARIMIQTKKEKEYF